MFKRLREQIKRLPIIGALLHEVYLRIFRNEGQKIVIETGPLAGKVWVRFMRTYNDQYCSGTYEPGIQKALAKHLRPGMVFYDIGANAGFFSLLGSLLVGPSGRVISFEPHPATARSCKAQLKANSLENVTVVVAAVTDTVGTAELSDGEYSVMTSLKDAGTAPKTITVATTTLDREITEYPVPDVVKIDIEGAEIDALRGAHVLIDNNKPIFLVELHSKELATQYEALMKAYGYQTFSTEGEIVSPSKGGERFVVSTPIS
jgi:FkbM family methyltransferase